MDILKIFQEKVEELGLDEVALQLNSPKHIVSQFVKGSKTPGFLTCQKILDLWAPKVFHDSQIVLNKSCSTLTCDNEDMLNVQKESTEKISEVLSEMSCEIHEEFQENPSSELDPKNEIERSELRPRLSESRKVNKDILRGMWKSKLSNASSKLQISSSGGLVVPSMSYEAPLEKPLWEGRDVCLCLPWYKETYPNTVLCIMAMWDKTKMRMELRSDDSMITRSRNQLAKRFLDTGCTWSIWFDDDMVFPFGHAGIYMTITNMRHIPERFLGIHTINRLISHGKTIVGGCYWDRRGGGKLIAGGGNIMQSIPSDVIQPVGFVGTGCLAIHRQVFLDIATKYPDTLHSDSLGNECGFFTNIQTPQRMLGEDESFAVRANEAGHPSFLDLAVICGHIGQNIHGIPLNGSKI